MSLNSSRMASNFLAVQGIMATDTTRFTQLPKYSFITEPNISIGERQVEIFSNISGWRVSAKRIQAGQQEV